MQYVVCKHFLLKVKESIRSETIRLFCSRKGNTLLLIEFKNL